MSTARDREPSKVYLNCGHSALFWPSPKRGDMVYCYKCADYLRVIKGHMSTIQGVIWLRCNDCAYTRKFITGLEDVRIRAETHMIRMGHHVKIVDASGKVRSVKPYGRKSTERD